MQKKKTKRKASKKKKNNIFKSRGSIIDKGTVYVVVILTLLIFGGYIMVGGTLPTKIPKENTNLVAINKPPLEPSKSSLQLRTFSGATITPFSTQPPLPTDTPNQPTLVDCGGQITGTQEIEMLWAYSLDTSPASGNQLALKAFYTNKYALLLGSGSISSMQKHPADHIAGPNIGNTAIKDNDNFPLFPAVFLTDITNNPGDTSGDAQTGGQPNKPDDIYGTWKASGTPDPVANNTNLGPGADTWPPANGPGDGPHDSNFTAGIIWKLSSIKAKNNVGLLPGHIYRAQIALHDGGNPGDIGVACLNFQVPYNGPTPTLPVASSFRFVAWADSRSNSDTEGVNSATLSTLAGKINGLNPTPVFTMFPGDLCKSFTTICVGTKWKNALGTTLFNKTFGIRGNHDNASTISQWQSIFNPGTIVTNIGGSNYSSSSLDFSFDYGKSHFVVIDLPGGGINSMSSSKITWLDNDLKTAETRLGTNLKHEFIFWHGPLYTVTNNHSGEKPSGTLINVINTHPLISAGFFGHEHVAIYANLNNSRVTGLNCPIEEFTMGRAGAPPSDVVKPVDFSAGQGNDTSADGFVTVDVNPDNGNYTVSIYKINGSVAWTHTFIETGTCN